MKPIAVHQRIGSNLIGYLNGLYGMASLVGGAFMGVSALRILPVREVLYRQLYFTGLEALNKMMTIGILIGIVIITQIINLTGSNVMFTGKILVWSILRELGPLLAAVIIIGRSSTAVAAELGSMKVQGEIKCIEAMGIDPMEYLLMPRILGITLSIVILTFYFEVAAIVGGILISTVLLDITLQRLLEGIFSAVGVFDVCISVLKSFLFGLVIAASSCYHGGRVGASITGIPRAATIAVMQSLFGVIVLDVTITLVSFL